MLRRALLFLSEREGLKDRLLRMRAAREVAERFVAGESLDEAIEAARQLNEDGFRVTLDLLGESVSDRDEAERATAAYEESVVRIAASDATATISLKLTQLGLDVDLDACVANLERIVTTAARHDSFVRIDMEGSKHTQPTLDVFRRVRAKHVNVGIVIQSYLQRTERDVDALLEADASVRLCKGAYKEPGSIAYQRKADIDASFIHLMRRLLDAADGREMVGGVPPVGIATHDEKMVEATRAFVESHAVEIDRFEFQMLYGVRREMQTQLREGGYHVRIYVPYGTEWYPYFMRRMAERPANLWFVTRAILGR